MNTLSHCVTAPNRQKTVNPFIAMNVLEISLLDKMQFIIGEIVNDFMF